MKKSIKICSLVAVMLAGFLADNILAASGDTRVCYWKDNKVGAISLQFDDSYNSHAMYMIPALLSRGLTGEFFINPGHMRYGFGIMTWEALCNRRGIGLGNHTFNHMGTIITTFDSNPNVVADYEIGETSRRIWSLNPPGRSKALILLRGGGTTWTNSNLW